MARIISDFRAVVLGTRKVLIKDESGSLTVGGANRTEVMSGQDVIGFTETGAPAELSMTCVLEAGSDFNEVFPGDRIDIRLQTTTGDEWLLRGAFLTSPPSFQGGAGEWSVSYKSKKALVTKKGS
jgi:hypothetical protein